MKTIALTAAIFASIISTAEQKNNNINSIETAALKARVTSLENDIALLKRQMFGEVPFTNLTEVVKVGDFVGTGTVYQLSICTRDFRMVSDSDEKKRARANEISRKERMKKLKDLQEARKRERASAMKQK